MAVPEHVSLLQRGATVWNTWRRNHPDVEPDFRWANFSLANLRGADLSHAKLDRTNLSGAMLSQATLTGASLREASLGEVNFASARLDEANLKRADLNRANLSRAALRGTDLTSANLSRTNLFEARLTQATLSEALLHQTSFGNTRLDGAIGLETCRHLGPSIIDHLTLTHNPDLPEAFLHGCGLQAWEIEAARLHDPTLSPAKITEIIQRIHRVRTEQSLQIHNLFLSYSHADAAFVEHLETHLKARHVLYWHDVHDAPAGRPDNIVARAMRRDPTVLLVLSEHSAERNWMEYEIDRARTLKQALRRTVLCLVTLDASWETADWPETLADEVAQYPILNFSNWQDPQTFDDMFARLMDHLDLFYETDTAQ